MSGSNLPFIEKAILYMLNSYLESNLITREEAIKALSDLSLQLQSIPQ